jgi:hypothetical protein
MYGSGSGGFRYLPARRPTLCQERLLVGADETGVPLDKALLKSEEKIANIGGAATSIVDNCENKVLWEAKACGGGVFAVSESDERHISGDKDCRKCLEQLGDGAGRGLNLGGCRFNPHSRANLKSQRQQGAGGFYHQKEHTGQLMRTDCFVRDGLPAFHHSGFGDEGVESRTKDSVEFSVLLVPKEHEVAAAHKVCGQQFVIRGATSLAIVRLSLYSRI